MRCYFLLLFALLASTANAKLFEGAARNPTVNGEPFHALHRPDLPVPLAMGMDIDNPIGREGPNTFMFRLPTIATNGMAYAIHEQFFAAHPSGFDMTTKEQMGYSFYVNPLTELASFTASYDPMPADGSPGRYVAVDFAGLDGNRPSFLYRGQTIAFDAGRYVLVVPEPSAWVVAVVLVACVVAGRKL